MPSHPDPVALRVPVPPPEAMTAEQRAIYDQTVAFLGAPVGPRMALLVAPEVAKGWAALSQSLSTSDLPRRLWELAILIVARHWDAQFEWWAHEGKALEHGVSPAVIDALKAGRDPAFERADEAALHRYMVELHRDHDVSDAAYEALRAILGVKTLVELTVLIGHYSSVAMTLAAHRIALPPGVVAPLPPKP